MGMSKKTQGLTLIELLVAIAIFAMISLAGFTIFNTVSEAARRGDEKLAQLNALQTAFLVLERDISQIAQRHIRLEGAESANVFLHANTEALSNANTGLAFVRYGWTNPQLMLPRSELQQVAYRLVDDKLERIHYNFVDPVLGEEPKVRTLLSGVLAFTFEYYYQNEWHKELQDKQMPKGIAVELELEELGIIRRQYLVAGIHAAKTG